MEKTKVGWREFISLQLEEWAVKNSVAYKEVARLIDGISAGGRTERQSSANLQQPEIYCQGLAAKPWHCPSDFPWVKALENSYSDIKSELIAVLNADYLQPHPELSKLASKGMWKEFRFYTSGTKNIQNSLLCPLTVEAIEKIPGATTAGSVFFAAAAPGTHIKPHYGPHNLRIRCHFGLICPTDCWMKVGTEKRCWDEGKCLLFDDSFLHEVNNESNMTRVVLILDVWHPDLTDIEIRASQYIMSLFSPNHISKLPLKDLPVFYGD